MLNSELSIMAAQARQFYPVRCAAISPGLPTPPKPPLQPRVTGHETRFYKTNPICKNAKQTETYAQKGFMKHLPHAIAEKTKPKQTQFSSSASRRAQTQHLLPVPRQFFPHHISQPTHFHCRTVLRPKKLVRGKTYDYAKQTQFAKMRNKPKPMSKKDL